MAENEVRIKYLEAMNKEVASLRGWLEFLERDLKNDRGVIHALILLSIAESCTKIVYQAGVLNGTVLSEYEHPTPDQRNWTSGVPADGIYWWRSFLLKRHGICHVEKGTTFMTTNTMPEEMPTDIEYNGPIALPF